MTGITGLNHVTLAVSDLPRAIAFYRDTLGGRLAADWDSGAYLELGSLWLCLSFGPVKPRDDYTHIALSCAPDNFATLANRIRATADLWQDNTSEGQSLYFLDPDGHRLELHVGTLQSRLSHYRTHPDKAVRLHGNT
ncbi:VOC family protein [Shimia sediminis]|uniref:VOC family protein n=1 Tax=Shimia sediminis TaxID=2497945 RepID=UPI000F8EC417|nr:VOC family protein [Shimia sediminis]